MNAPKHTENIQNESWPRTLAEAVLPERGQFEANLLGRLRKAQVPGRKPVVRRFRPTFRYATAAVATSFIGVVLYGWLAGPSSPGSLFVHQGDVQVGIAEREDARLAKGATVKCGEGGLATVKLKHETWLRMGNSSALTVNDSRNVHLTAGSLYAKVGRVQNGEPFVVETPSARVVVLGTVFEVRCQDNRTEVLVTEGKVRVEWKEREFSLTKNEGVTLSPSEPTPKVRSVKTTEPAWLQTLLALEMRRNFPSWSLNLPTSGPLAP